MKGDPHNYKNELENVKTRIQEADLEKQNQKTLLEFLNYLKGQGLSKTRVIRYASGWKVLLENIEIDFNIQEASKEDLRELVGIINQNQVKERDLSEHTLREYKKCINKMYGDFLKETQGIPGEDMTDFFTLTISDNKVDPDTLPRPSHVKQLINSCDRVRDRALIAVLWSSGGRISEVIGLQWKNVNFKNEVVRITFEDTKTGGKRVVPLRAGISFLQQLKQQDPLGEDREAYVFRNLETAEQISYSAASDIIKRAASKATLPDRIKVNPHAFRKGRATYLAAKGVNQATICEYFGWAQGSKEAAKYIRMAESDVENAVKNIAGLDSAEEEIEEDINPVQCYNCQALNSFQASTCINCGSELTMSKFYEEQKIQEIEEEITRDLALQNMDYDEDDIREKARELFDEGGSQ